jgi:hypothetical protein
LVNLHGRAEERYGRKRMSLNSKTGAKWPVLKKFNGKKVMELTAVANMSKICNTYGHIWD